MLAVGGEVLRGFPLNANSTYKKDFTPKDGKQVDLIKTNGNLKIGEPWIGSSTYRDNYLKPNETYATGWKSNRSNIPDPKDPNRFGR